MAEQDDPPLGIQLVSLIVRSYDEAIEFFTKKLDFTLVEDSPAVTSQGNRPKRWVVVKPPGNPQGCAILLAQADGEHQKATIGQQFAGRVGLFLRVANFNETYDRMCSEGITFIREPHDAPYGRVAVFRDISGNQWDLLGPPPRLESR